MVNRYFPGRRGFLGLAGSAVAGTVLYAACQPQPIEVTRVVEKPVEKVVEKAVEVSKVVEKSIEVTKLVEKQVVVTSAPKARERVEVILDSDWLPFGDSGRGKVMQDALDLWHANNKPRVIARAEDGCDHTKAIATDTMGDITLSCGNTLAYYADAGIFQDITANLKAKNYDFSDIVKHEGYYTYKGAYIGLPFQFNVFDWIANKTMIETAGATVPDSQKWVWDDIVEVGRKVTNPDKNLWGTEAAVSNVWPLWHTAVYAAGGELISKDGTKTLLGEGPSVDAFQMLADWIFKWKVNPTPKQQADGKIAYSGGNVAISWGMADQRTKFQSVQMLPPKHAKTGLRFSMMNAQPHLVTRWAAKRDVVAEAADLVVFLAGKEVQEINAKQGGAQPFRMSIFNSDLFAPKETRDVLIESNKYRVPYSFFLTKYWLAWSGQVVPLVRKGLVGELAMKEALAQASQAGTKALTGELGVGL